jgi:hypothetical protein
VDLPGPREIRRGTRENGRCLRDLINPESIAHDIRQKWRCGKVN